MKEYIPQESDRISHPFITNNRFTLFFWKEPTVYLFLRLPCVATAYRSGAGKLPPWPWRRKGPKGRMKKKHGVLIKLLTCMHEPPEIFWLNISFNLFDWKGVGGRPQNIPTKGPRIFRRWVRATLQACMEPALQKMACLPCGTKIAVCNLSCTRQRYNTR